VQKLLDSTLADNAHLNKMVAARDKRIRELEQELDQVKSELEAAQQQNAKLLPGNCLGKNLEQATPSPQSENDRSFVSMRLQEGQNGVEDLASPLVENQSLLDPSVLSTVSEVVAPDEVFRPEELDSPVKSRSREARPTQGARGGSSSLSPTSRRSCWTDRSVVQSAPLTPTSEKWPTHRPLSSGTARSSSARLSPVSGSRASRLCSSGRSPRSTILFPALRPPMDAIDRAIVQFFEKRPNVARRVAEAIGGVSRLTRVGRSWYDFGYERVHIFIPKRAGFCLARADDYLVAQVDGPDTEVPFKSYLMDLIDRSVDLQRASRGPPALGDFSGILTSLLNRGSRH